MLRRTFLQLSAAVLVGRFSYAIEGTSDFWWKGATIQFFVLQDGRLERRISGKASCEAPWNAILDHGMPETQDGYQRTVLSIQYHRDGLMVYKIHDTEAIPRTTSPARCGHDGGLAGLLKVMTRDDE